MKKVALSALAAAMISGVASADAITLYTDPKTGQVFTTAGEGRVEMGDFISAKEVDIANRETSSFIAEFGENAKKDVTVIDSKSPKFILGQETGPNMKIKAKDNKDMYLKLGTRMQGTFERREKEYNSDSSKAGNDIETNDAYGRRVRLEVEAGFDKYTSFTMDIRNDNVNAGDDGEKTFNVGDAYLQIKKPFDTSLVNFKLYRGKIDVSRTETAKSAYTIHYDRPHVADEAAQFITHNRRGTNAQMFGDWEKKFHYSFGFGDGVYSGAMKDAVGNTLNGVTISGSTKGKIDSQDFFYGGKIKLSPFDGWEEKKVTETYFGHGKHFTVGAAYWKTGTIDTNLANIGPIDHELINLELSAHYEGASFSAEYFDFDGVVKDFTAVNKEIGKSTGWYAQGEYVFTDLGYIAPFFRYESWDKFKGEDGYDFKSKIAGINWYLRGNSTKVGLAWQKDSYGSELKDGSYEDTRYKVTTQFFF